VQLLLDTCAAIFAVEGELKPSALNVLESQAATGAALLLSPITGWEIGLLSSRGRLLLQLHPRQYLHRLTSLPGVQLAPLTPEILLESSFLPGTPPRDPADRIIAATARELGLQVMTRDAALLAYASAGYLSAVEC
jgi:PIN domain nuclease of toxin-antitoxin system